ncbi:uncharacterized protein OCT59_009848 [Rhizophagus irregularis]|uniref:Uncharacterized protein n=4 Tax=Rhizophagus irregularis TaxID=588596 RepID=A0A015JT26_RHIIW|nr:hypothetical protein RirG_087120 [Rhizophagus irregularis DAOM 197198w]UZO18535.1 hypothetical protein OCT59_009848 [Rhizophagus irregularis]GBC29238.1 hypothetical protein GLOIN_2v1716532 [Rhizophagus irregularis DAOM 181602=DAOM 197198]
MNSSHYTFAETLSDKMDDSDSDNNKMMYDPETDKNVYNECFPQTTKKFYDMKRPENSSLTEIMEQTSITLKTMSKEINEINDQNRNLQDENNKLKEDCDNLYREKLSIERNFSRAKDYYESKIKDLELNDQIKKLLDENNKLKEDNENLLRENQILKQNSAEAKLKLQQINEANPQKIHEQTEIIMSLQNQLSDKENNIRDLVQRNVKLKDEASKYQSALGESMNVHLSNDDQNHSVQLKKDILELQRNLETYVTSLKPKIDINLKEVGILIKQYSCEKEIIPENLDRPFIKGVLQRKVLHQIFEFLGNYKKYREEEFSLESDIDSKARELLSLIKKFSETRVGTDEVSKVAAIKIRQQIYEILGNRGFSDIISSQGTHIHNFIYYSSQTLNEIMNQYRRINDVERKNEVEQLAPTLIRDVLKIFWFRLMVQEPVPDIKFFENNIKINPNLMTGRWEDDDLDEICVNLCYFPLIGRDLDSDSDYKVITHAKVLPHPIQNQI